jgi:hypothetical protein
MTPTPSAKGGRVGVIEPSKNALLQRATAPGLNLIT